MTFPNPRPTPGPLPLTPGPAQPAVATELAQTPPDTERLVAGIHAGLRALDGLDSVPLAEHVARFQQVHERLQEALTEIDGV